MKMKDSGIAWIGEIPEEWELSKIGAVYEERNQKVSDADFPPLSVTKQGVVPQLETAAKTIDGENRKLICKNDFVINSRSDRRGSCGISEYDGSCSLINTVLKPKRNMCNAYYSFVFRSERFADEFYRWGNGIVDDLWSTKWSNMKRIYIPAPSLQEQHRIADYLDRKCSQIDAIIARQQEVIEKLKAYKLSVITEAVTKGLNPHAPMKDSGDDFIGVMPKHWNVTKLGMLFDFCGGYAYSSDSYTSESDNQVVRIGNVKNGYMALENAPVYISDKSAVATDKFRINPGSILFTMTGTKGKRDYFFTHLVTKEDCKGKKLFLNQRVGCFLPRKNIDAGYYNYLLKEKRILDSIFVYETGTANQGNLGIESIRRTKVQLPSKEEQIKIREYLDDRCSRIECLLTRKSKIIYRLIDYKKSLIYEVITGKKEV